MPVDLAAVTAMEPADEGRDNTGTPTYKTGVF
jgi:hypothetical protein